MTENAPTELTILFADMCRSTVLFEKLGDEAALNLIMQALQMAGGCAEQNHGTVIGTIGDEVMCTFENPENALITANLIHTRMQNSPMMQTHQLAMRVGINSGKAVAMKNSVYGEAVNIAARLAQQAKANQSLIASATIDSVRKHLRNQLRFIGKMNLQGKAGPLEVHELLGAAKDDEITEVTTTNELESRSFLMTARYLTRQMRFDPMLVRFLFGRSLDCDQVIDHPTISREHAEFIYRNGQFLLRDFSTNGSIVIQGNKIEQLRRSSIELRGTGKIYLGKTVRQRQFCIDYTCITSR